MRPAHTRSNDVARRRGVTLLEMLVTVALLLLMMSIIASVFQAATGAVTVSRIYTLLDQDLRRLDTLLRQDLSGVTCKMTPPNDPRENRGYFEYAENALSDAQDEDSDDTLRFTSQADPDHPFTGRVWVPRSIPMTDPTYASTNAATLTPIPVTSQYAEIIYFQRGTKLYRRVLLIGPKLATSAVGNFPSDPPTAGDTAFIRSGASRIGYATNLFEPFALFQGGTATVQVGGFPFVSWQGLNDVSARPSPFKIPANANQPLREYTPIPNLLSDLTDRQNRFASPRFSDDFLSSVVNSPNPPTWQLPPDTLPDDVNLDGVQDYYPTMYFNSKAANLLNDSFAITDTNRPLTRDIVGFPWIFPNATSGTIQGNVVAIHSPDPSLNSFNHNPLVEGDSLNTPTARQTWWGFPTWRETMAPTWLDPIKRINDPATAPFFSIGDTIVSTYGGAVYNQIPGLSPTQTFNSTPFALPPQPDQSPFSDNFPTSANLPNIYDLRNALDLTTCPVFEDDLIANNVRSFNVKAFDPYPKYYNTNVGRFVSLLPGYFDLGYISGINPATGLPDPAYASGSALAPAFINNMPIGTVTGTNPYFLDCLGHEGRMPPLTADLRVDPQYPSPSVSYPFNNSQMQLRVGVGDDTTTVVRLRRIWDSWSTTYTNAPALPLNLGTGPLTGPTTGQFAGFNYSPAITSYPAPYPVPLRGIQIEIRVTDPDSQYIKTLTIKQDFSEKL